MSLKLSPGCQCCDTACPCDDMSGGPPAEYDVTFSGWSGSTVESCEFGTGTCEDLNDTFTFAYPYNHNQLSAPCTGWANFIIDDYYYVWANQNCAQIPDNPSWVCYWSYPFSTTWNCDLYEEMAPSGDTIGRGMTIYGFTLARFQYGSGGCLWRLIPHYRISLICQNSFDSVSDYSYTDWYWEFGDRSTKKCDFDGTETWTLHTPSELSVTCDDTYTTNLSDFCTGTLMPSVVSG